MSIAELFPIVTPGLLVVASAVWLARRERAAHEDVIDLRDLPPVRLAPVEGGATGRHRMPAPVEGGLVEAPAAGSLGARMLAMQEALAAPTAGEGPGCVGTGQAATDRRRRPLVAVSRTPGRG